MMGTRAVQNKDRIDKLRTGVRASAVILPLLGITWVFGLLSFNSATLVFKYIFAIMNSLQGLMVFIFHCLLNKQVSEGSFTRSHGRDKHNTSSTHAGAVLYQSSRWSGNDLWPQSERQTRLDAGKCNACALVVHTYFVLFLYVWVWTTGCCDEAVVLPLFYCEFHSS